MKVLIWIWLIASIVIFFYSTVGIYIHIVRDSVKTASPVKEMGNIYRKRIRIALPLLLLAGVSFWLILTFFGEYI